jgi:hypothetical protein
MPEAGKDASTTVRVALEDLDGRTRMTLTDGPLPFGREHAEAGYRAAVEKLAAHVSKR